MPGLPDAVSCVLAAWIALLGPVLGAQAPQRAPAGYPADDTVWPNQHSFANSDPWLAEHHDGIRLLEPRVLVVNFANGASSERVQRHTEAMIAALAESSRYHGYADPTAPVTLAYRVFRYVDLQDAEPARGRERRNGSRYPKRPGYDGRGQNCDYGAFFRDDFAAHYGVPDPDRPGELLSLARMIDAGLVHELWFYCYHDDEGAPLESIEDKQHYDAELRPIAGRHGWAGNGHSDTLPWIGRSFRVTFFNIERGIGCGLENFGHALEGMAHGHFCPYFERYFDEFAGFDLDRRHGLPFRSLYEAPARDGWKARYPAPGVLQYHDGDAVRSLEGYHVVGGNVHFPPGASGDYDLTSDVPVLSTIEHYRLRDGPDGADRAEPWRMRSFYRYRELAPDCMGQWLVYWRQNMPGYRSPCVDDDGAPMKSWWVFLFY
ncbi:MAG: hypothetical protein IPM29_25545 [Planctomycetes bacterium]|nr:hypothetical protein [Planctomycetota bacterium]